jgi:hypothetical protein
VRRTEQRDGLMGDNAWQGSQGALRYLPQLHTPPAVSRSWTPVEVDSSGLLTLLKLLREMRGEDEHGSHRTTS